MLFGGPKETRGARVRDPEISCELGPQRLLLVSENIFSQNIFIPRTQGPDIKNIFLPTIQGPDMKNIFLPTMQGPDKKNIFLPTTQGPGMKNIFCKSEDL